MCVKITAQNQQPSTGDASTRKQANTKQTKTVPICDGQQVYAPFSAPEHQEEDRKAVRRVDHRRHTADDDDVDAGAAGGGLGQVDRLTRCECGRRTSSWGDDDVAVVVVVVVSVEVVVVASVNCCCTTAGKCFIVVAGGACEWDNNRYGNACVFVYVDSLSLSVDGDEGVVDYTFRGDASAAAAETIGRMAAMFPCPELFSVEYV